jgi:membrane-associated phospholipid phosphatase
VPSRTADATDDSSNASPPSGRSQLAAPPTLVWRWPVFQTAEYFATVGFAALSLAGAAIPVGEGRWTARNAVDEDVRGALRASTRAGRRRADDASDVLVALSMNHVLFDAVVVAWAVHRRQSVAMQMTLIDLETIAFSRGVSLVVKSSVARERPFAEECDTDPVFGQLDSCEGSERYRSFWSGHSSTAFTAAGLTCIHHANLPLYGGGMADALACVAALGVAGATAMLRVVADEHHTTDILAGALFGTMTGVGVPWLLHYAHGRAPLAPSAKPPDLVLAFVPTPSGLGVGGFF